MRSCTYENRGIFCDCLCNYQHLLLFFLFARILRSFKFCTGFHDILAEVSVQIKLIMKFYVKKCPNVAIFSSFFYDFLNIMFYFYSTSRGAIAGPSGEGQEGDSEPAAKERRCC